MTDATAALPSPLWPVEAVFRAPGLTADELAITPDPAWYRAADGTPLAVLTWQPPPGRPPRGVVVLLHGVQSHAGWYHGLGRRLAARGFVTRFPDRRGSGASSGNRGDAASARQLIDDIATLLDQTRAAWPGLPVVLGGISWGGKIVMALAARHPRSVDALALVCPGLRPRVGVTRRERLGVIAALLTGRKHARRFPIPLADPALFTANPDAQAFLRQDPLSLRTGTAGLLATSFFLDRRVRRAPRRVPHPVLLMLAGQDRIVDNDQTLAYFDQIASLSRTLITYPVAHHTLDFEPEPEPAHYVNDLVAWLDQLHLPQRPAPAPAGQGSAARHE